MSRIAGDFRGSGRIPQEKNSVPYSPAPAALAQDRTAPHRKEQCPLLKHPLFKPLSHHVGSRLAVFFRHLHVFPGIPIRCSVGGKVSAKAQESTRRSCPLCGSPQRQLKFSKRGWIVRTTEIVDDGPTELSEVACAAEVKCGVTPDNRGNQGQSQDDLHSGDPQPDEQYTGRRVSGAQKHDPKGTASEPTDARNANTIPSRRPLGESHSSPLMLFL